MANSFRESLQVLLLLGLVLRIGCLAKYASARVRRLLLALMPLGEDLSLSSLMGTADHAVVVNRLTV